MITDTGYYFCARRPQYGTDEDDGTSDCCVCAGMLGRGDFARDVPEVRYDNYGIGTDCDARYAGLSPDQSLALSEAMVALGELVLTWVRRGDQDGEEERTSVDALQTA